MRGYFKWAIVGLAVSAVLLEGPGAFSQVRPGTSQYGSSLSSSMRAGLKGDALIQFDKDTNSLVVVTDPATNEQIKKVVEALDTPVPQVLINVLFLEVTHTKDLDFGVEALSQHTKKRGTLTNPVVDTQTLETIFGLADQTTGGFYKIIDQDVELTVRALAEVTKLEVLSRPSILTRNNQQAEITVGQRVPFIQNSRVTQDGQTINTVTYDDIGIILQVTPHITEDRVVSMDVTPEISAISDQHVKISDTIDAPVFDMRSAQTGVVVPDGKTVVIGGLMENSKKNDNLKLPILGDIPLLGKLFSSKTGSKTKTELLIFLTPHVIENATELESVSASERNKSQLAPTAFTKDEMGHFLDNKRGKDASPPAPEPKSDSAKKPGPIKMKKE